MSDYIHYIEDNKIKLGTIAFEIGDIPLGVEQYSRALERLRNYQGDRMAPMHLAADLTNQILEARTLSCNKTPILTFDHWTLSKSSFVKGIQCKKYLFLDKYKKRERTPPNFKKRALFSKGVSFEDTFRQHMFPDGVNVKEELGMNFAYFNSYTNHLLNSSSKTTLFEATIIENEIFIMVDVLHKLKNGTFDFYEIKLHTQMSEVIWNDLAIQYYVAKKRFGNKVNTFNVVLRKKTNEWKVINLKDELEERIINIEDEINAFKRVLKNNEPKVETGNHCKIPYECEFKSYCKSL